MDIFFDGYKPMHETKDPGQLALGLIDCGDTPRLITLDKPDLVGSQSSYEVVKASPANVVSASFWSDLGHEPVLAYTWLDPQYAPIVSAMHKAGRTVILKLDTDGRVGYPLSTSGPTTFGSLAHLALRGAKWHALWRQKMLPMCEQVVAAKGVVVETPEALSNVASFFVYWGREDLLPKLNCIPNPVSPEVFTVVPETMARENLVVTVGRWEDTAHKNTAGMVQAAARFLEKRPDYRVAVIGSGRHLVTRMVAGLSPSIGERIDIVGEISHCDMNQWYSRSKTVFVPSTSESFHIAAAEALCCGCSVCGTPLGAMRYFTNSGLSGVVSSSYSPDSLVSALLVDAAQWDKGLYSPVEIAAHWRKILSRKDIASKILALAVEGKAQDTGSKLTPSSDRGQSDNETRLG